MNYKEISGCLIELAKSGAFDVIAHGVNCQNIQGAGIALQMKETFFTDRFHKEQTGKGDINKLGQIDAQFFMLHEAGVFSPVFNGRSNSKYIKDIYVVNAYTQFKYGKNHHDGDEKPIDYEALTLCMRKINHEFPGKKIGLPQIGAGLAGGDWNIIKEIIKKELKDCDVTVVIYNKD